METLRDQQLQRFNELKAQQSGFLPYWRDLSDYVDPTTSRYLLTDRNRNTRNLRNTKVINGRATLARETLVHGLMSGMTNPAQAWLEYRTGDPDLDKYRPVKVYLDLLRKRFRHLARTLHPDVNPVDHAEFARINSAYRTLLKLMNV